MKWENIKEAKQNDEERSEGEKEKKKKKRGSGQKIQITCPFQKQRTD